MTSTAFYPRNKSYGDKAFQYNGNRKTNTYEVKVSTNFFQVKNSKSSYNSKPVWYGDNYQSTYKRDNHFDSTESNWKQKQYNIKKQSNSPYSTTASEANLENEIQGFKVVQSGKVLIDGQQSSDSDSIFSPAETEKQAPAKEEFRFASATKFLGPNPQVISMPSFL